MKPFCEDRDGMLPEENAERTIQRAGIAKPFARYAASLFTWREKRGKAVVRIFSILGVVLLIGTTIGAVCFLSVNRIDPTLFLWSNQATTSEDGLTMSLRITPGPYFLSELLAVDVSLTNETQKPVFVGLPCAVNRCGDFGRIAVTGGSGPSYELPFDPPMPDVHYSIDLGSELLKPGQTWKLHTNVLLTKSGKQILIARAYLYKDPAETNFYADRISSPLDDRWPQIGITVSPTIPAERKLAFGIDGTQVSVQAPFWTHLRYLYEMDCAISGEEGEGLAVAKQSNLYWDELTTHKIDSPACSGKKLRWDFAFAVPGYAMLTGTRVFS